MADSTLELALKIRAAVEGMDAVKSLGNSFVTTNQQIETLIRGLTAISGSSDGAAKEFEYLSEQARKYGISILDLSDNYVKFIASSKGTALEGEAARKIFEATASTMAVLGGETVTTHRAFTALSQIMSKGQIYAEELKGQLAEAIPGALQIMAKSLGISTQEMLNLMKAGQLTSEALLPFAIQLENQYGSLAASTTTFAQVTNRLQTEWALLMKRLGDTGAWKTLTESIDLLGKHSEVLAGTLGAGLSLAAFKVVSAIGASAIAAKEAVISYRLYGTAAEQAAKASLDKANADLRAAEQSVLNSEQQKRAAAISVAAAQASVAADERQLKSLLAKNAVMSDAVVALDRLTIAEKGKEIASRSVAIANDNYTRSLYESVVADTEAIAVSDRRIALATADVAARKATRIEASLEAYAKGQSLKSTQAELTALSQGVTVQELSSKAKERHTLLTEKETISTERLAAANTTYNLANANAREVLALRTAQLAGLSTAEERLLTITLANTAAAEGNVASSQAKLIAAQEQIAVIADLLGMTEAEIRVLVENGTATNEVAIAYNNLVAAEQKADSAKLKFIASSQQQVLVERELQIQVYSTLQQEEKAALAALNRASAAQRAAQLKADAARQAVVATEQEIAALNSGVTAQERKRELLAQLTIQQSNYNAAVERSTAANIRQSVAERTLNDLRQQSIVVDSEATAAANAKIATSERALVVAAREQAQAQLSYNLALRKVTQLQAEGGTAAQVAKANADLVLSEERLNAAKAKSVAASTTNTTAKNAETEALIAQGIASNNLAKSQGLLAKAWGLLTGPAGMIAMMVAGFAYMFIAFRDQDEATKNLSKSTEEYAESLKNMNAAQLIQSNNAAKELIDDKKLTISLMEKEIELLKNEQGFWAASAVSWTALGRSLQFWKTSAEQRIDAEAELIKQQQELSILEGKRAIGITKLLNTYDSLIENNKSLESSNSSLIVSQKTQQKVVDDLNSKWFKSTDEVIRLAVEQDKLREINKKLDSSTKALSSGILLADDALKTMSTSTGLTIDQLRAVFSGNEKYISSLEGRSLAIARSIQRSIELNRLEAESTHQLKILKAEYDRIEGSVKAKTEAEIKESTALGDLQKKRDAEISQGRVLIELAKLSIESTKAQIREIDIQIDRKKEEAIQNKKEEENINIAISKLQVQREELVKTQATRESNLVVVKAEAIAIEVANNLISESFIKNQAIIADSSNRIRELQTEYNNLGVTSEAVFNKKQTEILEQIRIEQEKVTEAARTMGVAMKEIFSTLGLDYDEAISGMDFQTRRMIDAFGLLGQGGLATAAQIQNAFTDVLGKADTEAELKALKFQLEQLGASGVISLESMRLKMTEVDEKLVDVEGAVNPVTIAFTKLGIGVPEQLQSIADSFGIAFDVIKDSEAPIEQVQSAFMKYAEAQVTASIASGEAIPKILEQKAASLGLSNAYQALIEKSRLVNKEFEAVVELFAKSNAELSQYQAKVEAVNSTELEWLTTKAQAAEVLGDEEAKRLALIAVSEQELVIARQQITANQEKLNAANAELSALTAIAESGKNLSKEQQQRLTDLKAEIPLLELQVSASKAKAEQSKNEALATKLANSIISEEFARQQKIVESASSEVGRLRTAYDTLKDAGAPIAVLNGILEQIDNEQKKVADGAKGMDAAMNAAFDAVGLNYQEVVTGMDSDTKRMIDAFAFSATSAAASAESIQKAFTDVLAKANTEEELLALQEELIKIGSQGKISGNQLAQSLAAVNTKIVDLRASVDPLQIAMEKLGIGVPEKLAAVANESERLYLTVKNSKAPLDEVQQAFLKYAENALVAAENGAKINIAQLESQASALGLGNAFAELKKKVSENSAEFDAIIAKYEKLTVAQGKENELAKASIVTTDERNKSSILLNENLGNELGLITDLIQEDQVKIDLLKQEVIENEKKLEQNTRELSDLRKLRDSGEQLSETQREQLKLLEEQLPIDEKSIEKSKEKVRQAESEALSYQNIIGDLNKVIAVAQQELNQSNDVLRSKKEKLEAEKALAIANGDTVKAQEKSIEIAKVELEIAKNIALAKREVAKATEEYAASLLKQAQADQIVTEEEQKAIDSANKLVAAKKLEADTADINVKAAEKNVEATKNVGKATEETAAKTKEASKGLVQFSKDWWDLTDAASAYYDTSIKLGKGTDFRWLGELKAGFDSAAQAEREAALAAGLLQDAFSQIDSGTFRGATSDIVQLMATTKKAEQVSYEYGFSVTQAGRDAISVINEIEQKWNELANTIESRNADLRAQLAELKGDQTAADSIRNQVDYTNNLAEAEAQLALVQNSSNIVAIAQAKENLRLIREIYEAKQAEIDLAAQQDKASRNVKESTTTASSQMNELATNAERAASAISALNGINLGGIQSQFNNLNKSVNGLNSLL